MNTYIKARRDEGFTLIELLIAIVVVGILTAVVIVGIGGLTNSGKKSTCQASYDAAKAAVAVHYANQTPNAYPTTIAQMTGATPPELELATGVTAAGATITGSNWSITLGAGGVLTPTGPGGTAGTCD
jgi:prepilin-type N-terminal cleavage/methylation domain-containing protein